MEFIAKKSFSVVHYDKNTFKPYYVYFVKNECYISNIIDEQPIHYQYIRINNCIFNTDNDEEDLFDKYLYDYFYTTTELRKIKLSKLNIFNK